MSFTFFQCRCLRAVMRGTLIIKIRSRLKSDTYGCTTAGCRWLTPEPGARTTEPQKATEALRTRTSICEGTTASVRVDAGGEMSGCRAASDAVDAPHPADDKASSCQAVSGLPGTPLSAAMSGVNYVPNPAAATGTPGTPNMGDSALPRR